MNKILIVEDNPINQRYFYHVLHKFFDVDLACNGLAALQILESKSFDLIIMDYLMPFMNGAEATSIIRKSNYANSIIPIIMITTNCLVEDKEYCLKCGVDDYLLKPILPDQLLNAVRKLLPVSNLE
jgi:CheY-like chemotaxis protein